MKSFHFVITSFIMCVLCISVKGQTQNNSNSKVSITNEPYRLEITQSFRKIAKGKKMQAIYLAVPRTNEYQQISNYYHEKGIFLEDSISSEYYLLWEIPKQVNTESGDWFEFSYEFDFIPKDDQFQTHTVGEVFPYDTTSNIYNEYTTNYYDFVVIDNPTMIEASDSIWAESSDIYDYANNCLYYINKNYTYRHINSIILSETIKNGGGDCGALAGLFITLCRIKKIPARFVVFHEHVWSEFYLENYGWIPVDPTFRYFGKAPSLYRNQICWANHIVSHVFDIKGESIVISGLINMLHYTYPEMPHNGYECKLKIEKK